MEDRCNNKNERNKTIFLYLENHSKKNNLGPILRCASAFGIQTVVVVGFAKCSVEGAHGASNHVQIIAFPTASQAAAYLRRREDCHCTTIIGLLGGIPNGYQPQSVFLDHDQYKDTPTALVVPNRHHHHHDDIDIETAATTITTTTLNRNVVDKNEEIQHEPDLRISFPISEDLPLPRNDDVEAGNIAIAVTKQPFGLEYELARHCDFFIHIPHVAIADEGNDQENQQNDPDDYDYEGAEIIPPSTWSPVLDLPTTLSIALHHITIHLNYQEGMFEGHKFHVGINKGKQIPGEDDAYEIQLKRDERVETKKQLQQELDHTMEDGALGRLMDDGDGRDEDDDDNNNGTATGDY